MIRASNLALAALAVTIASCGGPATAPAGPVSCGGATRERLECASEVSYQGAHTSGGFGVTQMVSANAKHEEVALRRVDEETERFIAMQTRLCRDYNACVLDTDAYQSESRAIRDRVGKVPALAEAVKSAKTDDERRRALDELYRSSVRDEYRVEEIQFRMGMTALMPDSVGGGEVAVRPGASVPTKARVAFNLDVSKDAYVYIFQTSPGGGVTVLFPNDRIGTKNPLKGGERATIPSGGKRFVVNDKDLGTERIYVAVSKEPLANLDGSLKKAAGNDAATIKDDELLQSFAALDTPEAGACKTRGLDLEGGGSGNGCTKSRGLDLEGGGASGSAAPTTSFSARSEPGDGHIVKVFPFRHMTEPEFLAQKSGPSGKPKTRDVTVEE